MQLLIVTTLQKRRKLDDLRKQVEEEKAKRAKQEGALQAAQAGREQSVKNLPHTHVV